MTLLSVWSLKELCISSMTPPLSPELIQQSLTPLAVVLTIHRLNSFVEPAGHWLGTCRCCGNGVNVAKPQKPCRRLIGGEEFEEEEVERPLITAAKLCIKAVQICLDRFLAAQEVDMTTRYESLLGDVRFFSQFAAARGWIKWICRSMSSEG